MKSLKTIFRLVPPILVLVLFVLFFGVGESQAHATTTVFQSGVYVMDDVHVLTGETWESAPNARVIITRSNGYPPTVRLEDNSVLRNIWIGGARGGQAYIHPRHNAILDGVTVFGYNEAVNVADAKNVKIVNSRFVNTGDGLLLHPIYVNNAGAVEGEGTTVEDNIFIGGEGYPIHLYHSPNWNSVRRNFVGGGMRCVAVEGYHNTVRDNIFWSNSDFACAWVGDDNGTGSLVFKQNLFGAPSTSHWLDYPSDSLVAKNWFVGDAYSFGTQPHEIAKSELPTYIGVTHNTIQGAVNALKTSFAQTPAQLLADGTIESNFDIFKNAVEMWAN